MGKATMKTALDTNILIYYLEGIEPQASKVGKILDGFMKSENDGLISTITVAEILTGFYVAEDISRATKVKKLLNDLTINSFKILPVTFEIADLAANLRAKKGGRLPDALIVATAINQKADMIYSQDKELQRFNKEIRICQLPE
ncbi:MAG: PIN domain-containing protein [Candidatus Bathyarchaeia archaeon]|jgi:predicted nucleic acid-binding protein